MYCITPVHHSEIDLSFSSLEGFHGLIGIIRMLEDFLVQAAIPESIRERLRGLLVALRVEGVLFRVHGCRRDPQHSTDMG